MTPVPASPAAQGSQALLLLPLARQGASFPSLAGRLVSGAWRSIFPIVKVGPCRAGRSDEPLTSWLGAEGSFLK